MNKVISSKPTQVATSALRALPFDNIIGGPLMACVRAQRLAAQTTVDFIREVGLEDVPVLKADGTPLKKTSLDRYGKPILDSSGKPVEEVVLEKKAVYVCFQFIQEGKLVRLNVPMLSIVPIPYIAINSIDIKFKANIKAQASAEERDSESERARVSQSQYSSQSSRRASVDWRRGEVGLGYNRSYGSDSMHASVSSKKDSVGTAESKYSVEYTMDVEVHASQDSLPAGMAKVLELIGNAMDVCSPDGEFLINGNQFVIPATGSDVQFEVIYKTPEGLHSTAKEDFVLIPLAPSPEANNLADLQAAALKKPFAEHSPNDYKGLVRSKERATAKLGVGAYLLLNFDLSLSELILVYKAAATSPSSPTS